MYRKKTCNAGQAQKALHIYDKASRFIMAGEIC